MRGVCRDENLLAGCLVTVFLPGLAALGLVAIILGILLAGCAGSRTGVVYPPIGAPVETGYGTVAYDLRATPGQVASGTAYVRRYMEHWAGHAPPFRVVVVARGSLFSDGRHVGGCRETGTGRVWLEHEAGGAVDAAEWEISLEAQGVPDPPWDPPRLGRWGAWGPIFSGQPSWALGLSL